MSADIADTAIAAAIFAVAAWGLRSGVAPPGWRLFMLLDSTGLLAYALANGEQTAAAFYAGLLLFLLRDWWKRRGKRAAKALGAKSRAVLAAVVDRAREAGTPMPEGARA